MSKNIKVSYYLLIVALIVSYFSNPSLLAQGKDVKDYPLFSRMDGYFVNKYNHVIYSEVDFSDSKEKGKYFGKGKYYYYEYRPNKGTPEPGKTAILRNYENVVQKLGGRIITTADRIKSNYFNFVLEHKGKKVWGSVAMAAHSNSVYRLTIVEEAPLPQQVEANPNYVPGSLPEPKYEKVPDRNGATSHPLFNNRMKGYYVYSNKKSDFESYNFVVSKTESYNKEGKIHETYYYLMPGAPYPGELGILKNYQNAIEKIGGETLLLNNDKGIFKLIQGTNEIWIELKFNKVYKRYYVTVLETKSMEQQIEANAEYIAENIKNQGRVALYGILFDTGKASIKAESAKALSEIAKFLEENKDMNFFVVGHTDWQGDFDANMKLSEDRAKSVLDWLVEKHKIDKKRLKAKGVGPLNPVAVNTNEAGKLLNRRVELVQDK